MPEIEVVNMDTVRQIEALSQVNAHGWILPRPDGTRAQCGGPKICRECQLEGLLFTATTKIAVVEGWVVRPGDSILLIAQPDTRPGDVKDTMKFLGEKLPDVKIVCVAGFTGVQIGKS